MPSVWLVLLVGAFLGMVMGLLGGGGGVIAVPLLVALGLTVREASTASLVVVGIGALAGLVPHHLARRVDWRMGFTFGALGSVGALVGARLAVVVSPWALAIGFPILLLIASAAMIRSARQQRVQHIDPATDENLAEAEPHTFRVKSWPLVIVLATGVGLVTGFFGVGGGFIVVPALIAALRMPVHRATATGLVVIAINSAVALTMRLSVAPSWSVTLTMAGATAVFAVVGAVVSRRVPAWVLSAGFGFLTFVIAVYSAVRLAFVHPA